MAEKSVPRKERVIAIDAPEQSHCMSIQSVSMRSSR